MHGHTSVSSRGTCEGGQKSGMIPPLLTGVFSKRGHFRKNWKSRFFVLELGRLSYFEKENTEEKEKKEKEKEGGGDTPVGQGSRIRGSGFLKSLVLRNVGLTHHDDPKMLVLVDGLTHFDLFLKASSVETAGIWRKRLTEHTYYAITYPNASLQLDHEEDDFRRSIAEALVANEVLTTKEEESEEEGGFMKETHSSSSNSSNSTQQVQEQLQLQEQRQEEEEDTEDVGDLFMKPPSKTSAPKASSVRRSSVLRPTLVREISESVLDMDFVFENQEQDFCQEGGGDGDQGSEEGRSSSSTGEDKGGEARGGGGGMSSGLAQKVRDSGLEAIGKQLKNLEKESKGSQERGLKEWNKTEAPKLKEAIKALDKKIEGLRKEQKTSLKNKTGFQSDFDEAVRELVTEQDALKLKLYFPSEPPVSFGSGGVYFAMDYIWLENLAGKFHLKLSSSSYGSQIVFKLLGAGGGDGAGVTADITIGGFKLKSENMRIPSLTLDQLNIRVCLRVELLLSFFAATQKWTATPEHFVVQLLSFKGPFGISRNMVAALLSIAVPVLKQRVLAMLPPELGVFLSDVMVPLDVQGSFQVEGSVVVQELFHGMQKSPAICQTLGYHPEQMMNFLGLQKSLDRKTNIKSLIDLLRYRNDHCKGGHWEGIIRLWDQAAILYYQIRQKSPGLLRQSEIVLTDEDLEFASSAFLSFEKLLLGAVQVEKNPLRVRFLLDTFRLDLTLCQMLRHAGEYYSRLAGELVEKEARGDVVTKASKRYVQKMQALCEDSQKHIEALRRVIHNLQFLLRMHITSGPEGGVSWVAKDVYTQFPISFTLPLSPDQDSIFSPLVPTIKNVRTKEDGFISYKLFHLGSPEMLKKAQFLAFKNKPRLDSMLSNAIQLGVGVGATERVVPPGGGSAPLPSSCPPPDVHVAQTKALEAFVLHCDKERWDTQQLLRVRPEKMSSVKICTVNVIRPRMAFIMNDVMTIQPGTALFTVQVGKSVPDMTEEGEEQQQGGGGGGKLQRQRYERERQQVRDSRRRTSTLLGDDATTLSHVHALSSLASFQHFDEVDEEGEGGEQEGDEENEENEENEEEGGEREEEEQELEQGAPVSAQGAHGLRTEANIPEMQFQGNIPKMLQFISNHFDDLQLLSDFYDEAVDESEERAEFMNFVLSIVAKYLLAPQFELLLNLGTMVSAHPSDVSVIFSTNQRYSPALNVFIKVDVLELLSDRDALMKAMVNS